MRDVRLRGVRADEQLLLDVFGVPALRKAREHLRLARRKVVLLGDVAAAVAEGRRVLRRVDRGRAFRARRHEGQQGVLGFGIIGAVEREGRNDDDRDHAGQLAEPFDRHIACAEREERNDNAEREAGPLRKAPHRVALHRVELELGVRHHKIGPFHKRRVGERSHGDGAAHNAPSMPEIGNEQDGCGDDRNGEALHAAHIPTRLRPLRRPEDRNARAYDARRRGNEHRPDARKRKHHDYEPVRHPVRGDRSRSLERDGRIALVALHRLQGVGVDAGNEDGGEHHARDHDERQTEQTHERTSRACDQKEERSCQRTADRDRHRRPLRGHHAEEHRPHKRERKLPRAKQHPDRNRAGHAPPFRDKPRPARARQNKCRGEQKQRARQHQGPHSPEHEVGELRAESEARVHHHARDDKAQDGDFQRLEGQKRKSRREHDIGAPDCEAREADRGEHARGGRLHHRLSPALAIHRIEERKRAGRDELAVGCGAGRGELAASCGAGRAAPAFRRGLGRSVGCTEIAARRGARIIHSHGIPRYKHESLREGDGIFPVQRESPSRCDSFFPPATHDSSIAEASRGNFKMRRNIGRQDGAAKSRGERHG